jgi:aerobic-type carbon monoxide dehydrogenase small subunit (CoxS/CutS family)
MESFIDVAMRVDGASVAARIRPRLLLSDFLRTEARAVSVHIGCGQGLCGACTVVVDGVPVRACLMLAVQADECTVQTVASQKALEGFAGEGLTPLQASFREHHALQCGFCTPGLLVSTALFLADTPRPARREILEHLNGHLCRCTGYANIIAAIEAVASNEAVTASGAVASSGAVA